MGGNASGGASVQEYMTKAERQKDTSQFTGRRNTLQISCLELPLDDPGQGTSGILPGPFPLAFYAFSDTGNMIISKNRENLAHWREVEGKEPDTLKSQNPLTSKDLSGTGRVTPDEFSPSGSIQTDRGKFHRHRAKYPECRCLQAKEGMAVQKLHLVATPDAGPDRQMTFTLGAGLCFILPEIRKKYYLLNNFNKLKTKTRQPCFLGIMALDFFEGTAILTPSESLLFGRVPAYLGIRLVLVIFRYVPF